MAENYDVLAAEIEKKELQPQGTDVSPEEYCKLLAIHLHKNDLCHAKFLWKRIPESVKNECPELGKIWSVGRAMWSRDAAAVFKSFENEWSESVAPIMTALVDVVRERNLNLIATAYTSLTLTTLSSQLGMDSTEAANYVIARRNWTVDDGTVYPTKSESPPSFISTAEEQLNVLTKFVSILEN